MRDGWYTNLFFSADKEGFLSTVRVVHRLDDNQAIKRNLRWELSQLLKERFQEKLQLVAFFCEIKRKIAKCLVIHDAGLIWFHIKGTWGVHSFAGDYLSIPSAHS